MAGERALPAGAYDNESYERSRPNSTRKGALLGRSGYSVGATGF